MIGVDARVSWLLAVVVVAASGPVAAADLVAPPAATPNDEAWEDAARGRLAAADPRDREACFKALERETRGELLSTDEARLILEYVVPGSKDGAAPVLRNLARSETQRKQAMQVAFNLLTEPQRAAFREIEEQLKTKGLDSLRPDQRDFAKGAGKEILHDAILDAAVRAPGRVAMAIQRANPLTQADRAAAGLHNWRGNELAMMLATAQILAERKFLLSEPQLKFARASRFLVPAMREYARPEVQERLKAATHERDQQQWAENERKRREAGELIAAVSQARIIELKKLIETDQAESARLAGEKQQIEGDVEDPSDRDAAELASITAQLKDATRRLKVNQHELHDLEAGKPPSRVKSRSPMPAGPPANPFGGRPGGVRRRWPTPM